MNDVDKTESANSANNISTVGQTYSFELKKSPTYQNHLKGCSKIR